MAADSSMGFHHQGITAAASVYNHHHHHMLSFQSSSGSDISMSGAGGGAGMGFATPRTMSGTSSTAGMYLSRNNNNHGGFGSAAVVGPSSRSSSGGGSTTASKYKFVTCSPSEWSDREQSILKEGLARSTLHVETFSDAHSFAASGIVDCFIFSASMDDVKQSVPRSNNITEGGMRSRNTSTSFVPDITRIRNTNRSFVTPGSTRIRNTITAVPFLALSISPTAHVSTCVVAAGFFLTWVILSCCWL